MTRILSRSGWLLGSGPSIFCAASVAGQIQIKATQIGGSADFQSPTVVAQPPGEARRLYVVERAGRVRMVRDGVTLVEPFIDLRGTVAAGGESGMLGMAFHPQFATNGQFYVCYTGGSGQAAGTQIVRMTTNPANPDVAQPDSVLSVMRINRAAGVNHQGGWLGFGPDGFLYVASGDGGVEANGQNKSVLLGKMLRIDVDHDGFPADPVRNYAIPAGNPFAGSVVAAREIWAYGLRNPWRNSFDRLTGDFWIGDVGESDPGEIDLETAGGSGPPEARNYGWPCMDGLQCHSSAAGCECNGPGLTQPIFDQRTLGGTATIGGYVYRGSAIPELTGTYLFGDYSGRFWSFRYVGGAVIELRERTGELGALHASSLGEDSAGELYICSIATPSAVYRVDRACYPNCDASTAAPILSINDFVCFLNRFAAGNTHANCDGSTLAPVLNVIDFVCFQTRYAQGCS